MKFDLEILDNYVKEGLVNRQKHPSLDLYIYNYTPECVFERKWDDITLQCRGLILDGEGNVIARPFVKFFNYNEVDVVIPDGVPQITTKMDGSLIIVTSYKKELIVATRGSFVSDQAPMAREILENNYNLTYMIHSSEGHHTYLFELTGPKNRIVVNYKENKLTLLAVITNYNGVEHNLEYYRGTAFIDVVEEYKVEWTKDVITKLQELNLPNEEGFVLKWSNGVRVKIKFADYIKLHRIITGVNEKRIWELMRDNENIDELLKQVPEEFSDWIQGVVSKIGSNYMSISTECYGFIADNKLREMSRKEAALLILKEEKLFAPVLFELLDSKEPKSIWKLIKPKTNKYFKENLKEEL